MVRIAVFDSGLGSLSIIKEMQKKFKAEIIYFADNQNFPYGTKTLNQIKNIMKNSINLLGKFEPDYIVVASNTPSLMLNLKSDKIFDVKPPIKDAKLISQTKNIGILATNSALKSKGIDNFLKKNKENPYKFYKINASNLVEIVESGKFLSEKKLVQKIIRDELEIISEKNIDVVTLSSTHLPFLKKFLKKEFPDVKFIDPGKIVANEIYLKIINNQSNRNSLKIFTSGDTKKFQKKLLKLGIKNKIIFLSF